MIPHVYPDLYSGRMWKAWLRLDVPQACIGRQQQSLKMLADVHRNLAQFRALQSEKPPRLIRRLNILRVSCRTRSHRLWWWRHVLEGAVRSSLLVLQRLSVLGELVQHRLRTLQAAESLACSLGGGCHPLASLGIFVWPPVLGAH